MGSVVELGAEDGIEQTWASGKGICSCVFLVGLGEAGGSETWEEVAGMVPPSQKDSEEV